jgi:hypothetical protein
MSQYQDRTLDSLRRAPVFLDAHSDVLGGIVNCQSRQDVDAAIAAVTEHRTNQGTAARQATGQMNRQSVFAEELAHSHMMPIATFARGKLRGVPEFAELTKKINVEKPKQLVVDARTMANAASKYVDQFVSAGFASDTVDKLRASADALDQAIQQRIESHGRRKASSDSIDHVLQQGRDAVTVLDALITQHLKSDHPLLATWKSESRIQDKPGRVRTKPVVEPTVTPVTPVTPIAPVSITPSSVAPATPKAA